MTHWWISCASSWVARTAVGLVLLLVQAPAGAWTPPTLPALDASSPSELTTYSDSPSARAGINDPFDAQVWWLDMDYRLGRFITTKTMRRPLLEKVMQAATRAGLSPELVMAVIQVESRFDARAVSPAGAIGLMQVMPFWKKIIGKPEDDLFDPQTNLAYGCTILAHYLSTEKGDMTDALARYNGSLGQTWYPERVMQAWNNQWWVIR
nr:lytic transglycosylase domain-containing protein [Larsenimonas rhizosphaerae]